MNYPRTDNIDESDDFHKYMGYSDDEHKYDQPLAKNRHLQS